MLPDRVSNPGPLTYESGALPIADNPLQQTTFINTISLFSEELRLDVSSESSAIHMQNQALFSLKDNSKNLKLRLLQFLFGALRVKMILSELLYKCIVYIFVKNGICWSIRIKIPTYRYLLFWLRW